MKMRAAALVGVVVLASTACASGDRGERGFVAKLAARAPQNDDSAAATTDDTTLAALGDVAGVAGPAGVAGSRRAGGGAGAKGKGAGAGAIVCPPPRKVARVGPGVSDTEIKIGFQVTGNLGAGFALVGAKGSPPAEKQMYDALIAWVNKTCGMAGRKLVPIFHETDPTSGTWATQAQATCATFTEDNQVLAVGSSVVGGSDALWACLTEKNKPLIEQNLWLFDHQYYDQRPGLLYQPGRMSPDRWGLAYVDGLVGAQYFDGNPKVGLIRFDAPVFQRISDNVVKPRMKAHGLAFTEEVAISSPESIAGFSSASSQISNAILRFRSAGITHVMFLENAGILPFLFMPAAESQGYRPRYGMSSNDIPNTQAGQVPPVQLRGSVAVGWLPPSDVDAAEAPPGNAAYQMCRDIVKAAGQTNLSGFYLEPPCDTLLFLRSVLDRATELTTDGIRAASEQLGTSYNSPLTFATRFGPGRYNGADQYRILFFDDGCTCYRFTGALHPVPSS